ncbi:hypothetical protein F5B18DRAFT_650447 [Nemania serpens]|nr:hypothetical protein F5B18DRAFT_650447 [Nemania serpens]
MDACGSMSSPAATVESDRQTPEDQTGSTFVAMKLMQLLHPEDNIRVIGSRKVNFSKLLGYGPRKERGSEATSTAGTLATAGALFAECAISDTSFTPPRQIEISRFAHLDEEGRRHVLAPPGFRNVAPRYIYEDYEVPAELSFERRTDYKKSDVQYGGISLAVMKQKAAQLTKTRKVRFEVAPISHDDTPKAQAAPIAFQPTTLEPIGLSPTSLSLIYAPSTTSSPTSTTDQPVAVWSSPFMKGVFEAENDLLYDSRWPASTF